MDHADAPPPHDEPLWDELDPVAVEPGSIGVVWGNCQAESIRRMIAPAGAADGVRMLRLPPVFEMTAAGVARLHALLPRAGVLVTQPVKDAYRIPGCGSRQLAALLPPAARVVTVPSTHYEGLFPWQVYGHDERGERVDAPVVDYHDLRLLDAADRGMDLAGALEHVASTDARPVGVRAVARDSIAELRRRAEPLDVDTSDAVLAAGVGAAWTVNHPSNTVLGALGASVLEILGWSGGPALPDHEMLGRIRTPVAEDVVTALGLPTGGAREHWQVDGADVGLQEIAGPAMALYRERPDVVSATLARYRERWESLTAR